MDFHSSWRSPSNIALIKYWGKRDIQLPQNPSLSFTLSACNTDMHVDAILDADKPGLNLLYDGKPMPSFVPKINSFFSNLNGVFPWLKNAHVEINSRNTFPHGAGIASSASSMSALALCLATIDDQMHGRVSQSGPAWLQKVSAIARLGSGSACRSLFPHAALWGKTNGVDTSEDEYATPWSEEIASVYHNYHDCILMVSSGEKKVSSSAGHELMNESVYAEARYKSAKRNLERLMEAMKSGNDPDTFISVCESEALQLHALMMASDKPFILMEPNTISIIHEVWRFREETSLPVCFTLDAGPNVHLLYPSSHQVQIERWIKNDLVSFCAKGRYIMDHVGNGPEPLPAF